MLLRFLPVMILLGITLLLLSAPPEEVRLQGFTGFNKSEKQAVVPVCYANHQLQLGVSIEKVSEAFNRSIDPDFDDYRSFQVAQWKEHMSDRGCDSLIKCTFKKGRLAALQIITTSRNQYNSKFELLQNLSSVYPCMQALLPVLNFGTNLRFEEENTAFYQSFKLLEINNKCNGVCYEMRYSDINLSNSPLQS